MTEQERCFFRVGYGHVFVRCAFVLEFMAKGWSYMPTIKRTPSSGIWLFKSIPEVEIVRA